MIREWSDKIEVPASTTECPAWLKGAKAGEWKWFNDRDPNGLGAPYSSESASWVGHQVHCASRLLDEGWHPASTMPTGDAIIDVQWTHGGFSSPGGCEAFHARRTAALREDGHRILCWRPAESTQPAAPEVAEKAPEAKPRRRVKLSDFVPIDDLSPADYSLFMDRRGGCRCCICPPCNACTDPVTAEELEALGVEFEDDVTPAIEAGNALAAMQNRDIEGAAAMQGRRDAEADRQSYAFFAGRPVRDARLLTVAPLGALCGAFRFGGDE